MDQRPTRSSTPCPLYPCVFFLLGQSCSNEQDFFHSISTQKVFDKTDILYYHGSWFLDCATAKLPHASLTFFRFNDLRVATFCNSFVFTFMHHCRGGGGSRFFFFFPSWNPGAQQLSMPSPPYNNARGCGVSHLHSTVIAGRLGSLPARTLGRRDEMSRTCP